MVIAVIKNLTQRKPEVERVTKETMEGVILLEQLKDQIKRKNIRLELRLRDGAA